jgi:hypothetical protein
MYVIYVINVLNICKLCILCKVCKLCNLCKKCIFTINQEDKVLELFFLNQQVDDNKD